MKNIHIIHFYILHLLFYILHYNNDFHLIVQMSELINYYPYTLNSF